MASYSTIKSGSRGSSVSELQKLLNQNGYGLSEDGIFGAKTQAAVRDYQAKNNLSVDGIVGQNTWGALYGAGGSTAGAAGEAQKTTADWLSEYEGKKPGGYAPSQDVSDALAALKEYEGKKPGEYQSKYEEQIDALLKGVLNREAFTYDFNADPLYQQYANQYQQKGKLAMADAMGAAAALSGGYGNSYAQTVGQQTYQGYLQGLNDVIPELRDAAYQLYQDGINRDMAGISLLQGMDERDYNRYRGDVSDYYNDLNYYYNRYNDMSGQDYNRYLNDQAAWEAERGYWYQKLMDEQAQANWQAEYDLALQAAKSSGGSGGSRTRRKGEPDDDPDDGNKTDPIPLTPTRSYLDYAKDRDALAKSVASGNPSSDLYSAMAQMGADPYNQEIARINAWKKAQNAKNKEKK